MAPTKTCPIPKPNPSPIPSPNPGTDVEAAEPPVPKILQGARHRKSGRYVAEIRHGNRRFWLGTFCTASEAGIAYDMAALRLRGQTYNFPADANGRIITAIDPAKQDSIEKEVEKRLRSNTRSGAEDAGKKAETSNKRKQAPKSGNKKLEGQARKKRKVEEKQRAKELEGFL